MQSQKKICFCFLFLNANLKKPTQQKPSAGVEAGPETEPPEHVSGETLSFGETLSLVAAGLGDHPAPPPARQRGRAQRAATRDHFRDSSPSSREQEERCMRPGPGRSAAAQAVAGRDRRVPPCGPVSPPGDGSRRGLIPTFGTGSRPPAGKASAAVHTAPALGAGAPLASRDGTRGLSADRATIGHILTGLRALPAEEGLARYIAP